MHQPVKVDGGGVGGGGPSDPPSAARTEPGPPGRCPLPLASDLCPLPSALRHSKLGVLHSAVLCGIPYFYTYSYTLLFCSPFRKDRRVRVRVRVRIGSRRAVGGWIGDPNGVAQVSPGRMPGFGPHQQTMLSEGEPQRCTVFGVRRLDAAFTARGLTRATPEQKSGVKPPHSKKDTSASPSEAEQ